jgi:hypothetical protein
MQGVERHHRAGQIHRFQECGGMARLIVLDVNFKVVQKVAAVFTRRRGGEPAMPSSAVAS